MTETINLSECKIAPKKLFNGFVGHGLVYWEEGDNEYKAHISYAREVTLSGKFTKENLEKMQLMAKSGNTSAGSDNKSVVLCPLNPVTLTHTNPITKEVYKMSVEIVDGVERVVCRSSIFPNNPGDYQKL